MGILNTPNPNDIAADLPLLQPNNEPTSPNLLQSASTPVPAHVALTSTTLSAPQGDIPPDLWEIARNTLGENASYLAVSKFAHKLDRDEKIGAGLTRESAFADQGFKTAKGPVKFDRDLVVAAAATGAMPWLDHGNNSDSTPTPVSSDNLSRDLAREFMNVGEESSLMRELGPDAHMTREQFHALMNKSMTSFHGEDAPLAAVALGAALSNRDKTMNGDQKLDATTKVLKENTELAKKLKADKASGNEQALKSDVNTLLKESQGGVDPTGEQVDRALHHMKHIQERMDHGHGLRREANMEKTAALDPNGMDGYAGHLKNHKVLAMGLPLQGALTTASTAVVTPPAAKIAAAAPARSPSMSMSG